MYNSHSPFLLLSWLPPCTRALGCSAAPPSPWRVSAPISRGSFRQAVAGKYSGTNPNREKRRKIREKVQATDGKVTCLISQNSRSYTRGGSFSPGFFMTPVTVPTACIKITRNEDWQHLGERFRDRFCLALVLFSIVERSGRARDTSFRAHSASFTYALGQLSPVFSQPTTGCPRVAADNHFTEHNSK